MKETKETSITYETIGVVGAGAWGTALAAAAAQAGRKVKLWARDASAAAAIDATRENARYLPGIALPDGIAATGNIEDAASCDALLVVVPAQHLRAVLPTLGAPAKPLVLCAKGIVRGPGKLLT